MKEMCGSGKQVCGLPVGGEGSPALPIHPAFCKYLPRELLGPRTALIGTWQGLSS